MRNCNNILNAENLIAGEVNNISCYLAAAYSLDNSFAVYKLASCEVEQSYAVLAKCKSFLVDGVLCILVIRKM
mgnify:CR=1 FL=1